MGSCFRLKAAGKDVRLNMENVRRTLSDLAIGDGQFDVVTIGPNEAQTWRRGWLAPIGPLPAGYDLADVIA